MRKLQSSNFKLLKKLVFELEMHQFRPIIFKMFNRILSGLGVAIALEKLENKCELVM